VRYGTPGAQPLESRATGIGGGGLFIESASPLPVGTDLELEFTLPERSTQWLRARGTVVWVCPKADQYTFSPGMGIRFTKISDEARGLVLALVESLRRKPLPE
jgi:type IV pilus assembly protein PilZ